MLSRDKKRRNFPLSFLSFPYLWLFTLNWQDHLIVFLLPFPKYHRTPAETHSFLSMKHTVMHRHSYTHRLNSVLAENRSLQKKISDGQQEEFQVSTPIRYTKRKQVLFRINLRGF